MTLDPRAHDGAARRDQPVRRRRRRGPGRIADRIGRDRRSRRPRDRPPGRDRDRVLRDRRRATVRVVRDGETLAELGPGDFFGELSVLDGKPRNAQVVSTEPTVCLALASWDFEAVVARAAERRAGHPARAGRAAARADRRAPALSRSLAPAMTASPPPSGHRHVPVHRHRGLDAARAGDRRPPATATLRERHRELLRAAFGATAAIEQGTEGDSFFVVFRCAPRGGRRRGRRASARWPRSPGRTGRRSGSGWASTPARPSVAGGDAVGLDINRAARIAARAHGGQIARLATRRARWSSGDLARRPAACATSASTGCKDLRAPERLVQVDATACRRRFPPLRTLDARPNNLPTQLTTFVGRERELGEAAALLGDDPAADADRAGRDGQDAALAAARRAASPTASRTGSASCRSSRSAIPTLVAPTIARRSASPRARTRADRRSLADWLARHAGRCSSSTTSSRSSPRRPIVADLLRAAARAEGPGHQPGGAARLGRAGVPRARPAGAARPARLSELERLNLPRAARARPRAARPVRGGAPVHRARRGGPARASR